MIAFDEESLECDFAETYHIYDFRELPVKRAALFAKGLREDSRIKLKISGMKTDSKTLLVARIFDELQWLNWSRTKDGSKGINRPKMLSKELVEYRETDKPKDECMRFESSADFKDAWDAIVERIEENGK